MLLKKIRKIFNEINNTTLLRIGRTCDMIEIDFKLNESVNLILHVFSFVRVIYCNNVLACSSDIFLPSSTFSGNQFVYDEDLSKFDECLLLWHDKINSGLVKKIIITKTMDIKIKLDNDIAIEIYMCNPLLNEDETEIWRYFKTNNCGERHRVLKIVKNKYVLYE